MVLTMTPFRSLLSSFKKFKWEKYDKEKLRDAEFLITRKVN